MIAPPADRAERWQELDGVRGIASLVVVLTHIQLSGPLQLSPGAEPWLSWIGILFDGTAAVAIFFVLSGVVLCLPMLADSRLQRWVAYYPRRLLRLYLPVWASLLLALVWTLAVPRQTEGVTPWVADHASPVSGGRLLRGFALLQPTVLNTPLWSLTWEVLFSLLFPLFFLVAARRSRWLSGVAVVGALALIKVGADLGNGWMTMLPQFLLGVALAPFLADIRAVGCRLPAAARFLIVGAALGGVWWSGRFAMPDSGVPAGWQWVLRMVSCTLLVLAAVGAPRVGSFLRTRTVQWLGLMSFSLYLVHEPLIVSLANLFATTSFALLLVTGVPASLFLAWAFYRTVERPSHLLSQRAGRRIARRWAEPPTPEVAR
ncbi:MAG: acyltransferase family protein [Propioniciclava sp.]